MEEYAGKGLGHPDAKQAEEEAGDSRRGPDAGAAGEVLLVPQVWLLVLRRRVYYHATRGVKSTEMLYSSKSKVQLL